ncbi:hypothetical protein DFAR_2170003 [Desulfarculales bacterium]
MPVVGDRERVLEVISGKDFLTRMNPDGPASFMAVVALALNAVLAWWRPFWGSWLPRL